MFQPILYKLGGCVYNIRNTHTPLYIGIGWNGWKLEEVGMGLNWGVSPVFVANMPESEKLQNMRFCT